MWMRGAWMSSETWMGGRAGRPSGGSRDREIVGRALSHSPVTEC